MDVSSAFKLNSQTIEQIKPIKTIDNIGGFEKVHGSGTEDMFGSILNSAINNISQTNKYLSDAENEEVKLALGQSDNTHDLAIALQKASTMLQYTVAIRDKFMEAYKEIMNMQF